MTLNKVEICGVETSTLPTLSHEEMQALMRRAHGGDAEARRELIQANLRLVLSVIQRFHNRGENLDDLFQVGCIGLMKGLDNFDMSLNVRLSTYCVPMIIGEIRRYLRDNNAVRVSRSMRDTAYRALRTREELSTGSGKEPTVAEIARAMDMPEEDVVLAMNSRRQIRSLSEPVGSGEEGLRLMDVLGVDTMPKVDARLTLARMLRDLPDRERAVIVRRYFKSHTQTQIAKDMGMTQVQVSRMESRVLKRMREMAGEG